MENLSSKIINDQMGCNWQMNTVKISIPYSYFSKLANLGWHDVLFAIENGFLSHESAIEHAVIEIEQNGNCPHEVTELACLLRNEAHYHIVYPLLVELANQTSDEVKKETKDKMLYVLLNWVFEHKESYEDPLEVVTIIYDDFGFPDSMIKFIRYMPSDEPPLDTTEAYIERIYSNWSDFLSAHKAKYVVPEQTRR